MCVEGCKLSCVVDFKSMFLAVECAVTA
eukprot:SAG25_NODE_10999_length_317_cov_0.697248_1_plen_27_part_01